MESISDEKWEDECFLLNDELAVKRMEGNIMRTLFVYLLLALFPIVASGSDCRTVETSNNIEVICDGNPSTNNAQAESNIKGPQFEEIYAGDKHDYQLKASVLDKYLNQLYELTKAGADLSQIDALVKSAGTIHFEIKTCFVYNLKDRREHISME